MRASEPNAFGYKTSENLGMIPLNGWVARASVSINQDGVGLVESLRQLQGVVSCERSGTGSEWADVVKIESSTKQDSALWRH
jgi:hypothetical protein